MGCVVGFYCSYGCYISYSNFPLNKREGFSVLFKRITELLQQHCCLTFTCFLFCYLILISNTDCKGCNLNGTMGNDWATIAETGGSF